MMLLLLSVALAADPIPGGFGAPAVSPATSQVIDAGVKAAAMGGGQAGGALSVEVYLDTSRSAGKHAKHDLALVEAIRASLRPSDLLRVTGFDGVLHPLGAAAAPSNEPALSALQYTGLATFYAPVVFDVAAQASAAGGRARVVVVATDGHSDPLNKSHGPMVSDPGPRDAPPATLGDVRVIWTLRDAPIAKPGADAATAPATWTEPSGITSQLVAWNPPAVWSPSATDLQSWIEALRPVPPPVMQPAPEAPPYDWAGLLTNLAEFGALGVAAILIAVGATAARRKASAKLKDAAIDGALRAPRQTMLRLEPRGGQPIERRISPGDQMDVGPGVGWPGVVLALPGNGFSLTIGRRGDRATIQPRGTRSAIAVLRNGRVLPVERNLSLEVCDGDVIADARTEAELVKLRFTAA